MFLKFSIYNIQKKLIKVESINMSIPILENCPICESKKINLFQKNIDRRKGILGKWDLWMCSECNIVFINPIPTEEELSLYYSKYSKSKEFKINVNSGSKFDRLRKLYHTISGDVDPRDFIVDFTSKRMLDLGFGQASYLNYFFSRGANIAGIEIADHIILEYEKKGYEVKKASNFNQIPYPNDEFDIIYLMQVFEHLAHPESILREMNRISKKDCQVYMAMPNSKSFWRTFFGEYWIAGWFTPFHLYFYDLQILKRLAEKNGFRVTKHFSSTPELWFRLNLKSLIYRENHEIDSLNIFWIDNPFSKIVIMLTLRFIELFIQEKDCILVKLEKFSELNEK